MKTDGTIFGQRVGTNIELVPAPDELTAFLENTKTDDGRGSQNSDLARYRELLKDFNAFKKHQPFDAAHRYFRETMFYGALGRSFFVSPALLSTVEQFKYHVYTLKALDFRKPAAFIRAAEEELGRLDPHRKADAVKLARLQGMIDERNKALEALEKRWAALIAELSDIALYIRDNLTRIKKACEASIVILVELQIRRKKEDDLIENIKANINEHLANSLRHGAITKEHLESAKKDIATLSQEMSSLFRDDIYALTGLFEAVHDHARKSAIEINALMGELNLRKGISVDGYQKLFTRIEQALVSLVSDYCFDMKIPRTQTATAYKHVLAETRREGLDHIFELLERERRSEKERRSHEDRRTFNDPDYEEPERRSNGNRRVGKKIRHSHEFFI
jgi:hypothetical protein